MSDGAIAITGATGFVGRRLAECAAPRPLRLFGGRTVPTEARAEPLGNGAGINLTGVSVLIHLAGAVHRRYDSAAYHEINVELSKRVLRAAADAGARRFVFASSILVHGDRPAGPCRPDTPIRPQSPYAASKAQAELVLTEMAQRLGIELVVVRPPLVYGPQAPGNFATLVKAIARGLPLPFGLARNRRSFVSVGNLSDLLLHVATCEAQPAPVLLPADPEDLDTRELCELIGEGLGRRVRFLPVPGRLMRLAAGAVGRGALYRSLFEDLAIDRSHWAGLGWAPPASARSEIPTAAAAGRRPPASPELTLERAAR